MQTVEAAAMSRMAKTIATRTLSSMYLPSKMPTHRAIAGETRGFLAQNVLANMALLFCLPCISATFRRNKRDSARIAV